jgi:hypothetical protein
MLSGRTFSSPRSWVKPDENRPGRFEQVVRHTAGLSLPEGVLVDNRFRGMSAEQIYNLRELDAEPQSVGQDELRRLYRIWVAVVDLYAGDKTHARIFLNAPNRNLENRAPIEFIENGNLAPLELFMDAMSVRQPAEGPALMSQSLCDCDRATALVQGRMLSPTPTTCRACRFTGTSTTAG